MIAELLKNTLHRPYELPNGRWRYYQEWNDALFLHWPVPAEIIKKLIPNGLEADTINGRAWVSVVAFTMQKIRPRGIPSVTAVSDFHEINVRVYVVKDNKPGVYFLSMEGHKRLSVFVAKSLSGLPYHASGMSRKKIDGISSYVSHNRIKNFHLDATYTVDETAYAKTAVDKWLTERYCLYVDIGKKLYRYDVHHSEWHLKNASLSKLELSYKIGGLVIKDAKPALAHHSAGVKVLAWKRQRVG
jgi:uncharacterized protein YqjF (DUF2071 family)